MPQSPLGERGVAFLLQGPNIVQLTALLATMTGPSHLILGVAAAILMSKIGIYDLSPVVLAAAGVGALLPDIEHQSSTIGRRIWPLSILLSKLLGHRGVTHSLMAVATLFIGLAILAGGFPAWLLALATGYLSHIAGDWLTPAGVPLFWPSKLRYRSAATLRPGGVVEAGLCGGLVLAAFFLLTAGN